jgi:hypothetical protein
MIRGRPEQLCGGRPRADEASTDGITGRDIAADKSEMIVPATVPHLKVEQGSAG